MGWRKIVNKPKKRAQNQRSTRHKVGMMRRNVGRTSKYSVAKEHHKDWMD